MLYSLSVSSLSRNAPFIELGLGACMLLSALVWIRGFFGLSVVAALGAGIIAIGRLGHTSYTEPFFAFLAIQTGLGALLDIRTLFSLDRATSSDARTMQSVFWLPAWFWALLWLVLSLGMAYETLIAFPA